MYKEHRERAEGNPFSSMPDPPRGDELLDLAFRRARMVQVKVSKTLPLKQKVKIKERAKIISASNIVTEKLDKVVSNIPILENLHPFYREIFEVMFNIRSFKNSLAKIKKARAITKKVLKAHLKLMKEASRLNEVVKVRKAFYGRLSSIVKEVDVDLAFLKEAGVELRELPSIDPEGLTIVVAGLPNVGKSSFVRCVSSAKPEVASYPFTTREVLCGHLNYGGFRVQVIDTPGLLDRPIHERSRVERLAIVALKHLAKAVIFIIDPSETSGYAIDEQVNVYRELVDFLKDVPIVPVFNKVGLASERKVMEARDRVGLTAILKMAASQCLGVREVLSRAIEYAEGCVDDQY